VDFRDGFFPGVVEWRFCWGFCEKWCADRGVLVVRCGQLRGGCGELADISFRAEKVTGC